MFAVFKSQAALAQQLEEKLVDHTGGLEQVFRPLAAKERAGDLAQMRVDELKKVVDRGGLSFAPLAEKHRDFARLGQDGRFPLQSRSLHGCAP